MSNKKRLCIIPCGSAKVWDSNPNAGPQKAEDVYTGVFAASCQRYARTFFDHWVILSAKHGFLFPGGMVSEAYNVSFIKPSSETITIEALEHQALQLGLLDFDEITVLGGKHYVERAKAIFRSGQQIELPLHDCKGIGYMLQRLSQALEGNVPIAHTSHVTENRERVLEESKAVPSIGKYTPLYHYLRVASESVITLSSEQIEEIVGFELPASSVKHRAWWANDISHSQAKAWLLADWEVQSISLPLITFNRMQGE